MLEQPIHIVTGAGDEQFSNDAVKVCKTCTSVSNELSPRCDVVIRAALRWQDRERRLVELCFLVFVLLKSLLCLFLFMFLHSYSMSLEMNHCLFWQILPNSFCELLYSDTFCDLRFLRNGYFVLWHLNKINKMHELLANITFFKVTFFIFLLESSI